MIDCMFLITEFFLITFKFKEKEYILPAELPKGGVALKDPNILKNRYPPIVVTIKGEADDVHYLLDQSPTNLTDMKLKLSQLKTIEQAQTQVRIVVDSKVHFKHLIRVFDTCKQLGIQNCGLIPSAPLTE